MGAAKQIIAVLNKSTAMSDNDVRSITAALAKQLEQDVNPAWDTNCTARFYADGETIPAGAWQLVVFDTSDQANALGYHDYSPTGGPLGKAFVESDIEAGASPSVTISHEGIEMAIDPDIVRCAYVQPTAGDVQFYALEPCDAVEGDSDGYEIDGWLMSNFVLDTWFLWQLSGTPGPFDHLGKLSLPLSLQPDGYLTVWTITGGWQQGTHAAGRQNPAARPAIGSRLERRALPRDQWRVSTPAGA